VLAKVIKLVGLTLLPFLSPTNLITFAGTQNGENTFSKLTLLDFRLNEHHRPILVVAVLFQSRFLADKSFYSHFYTKNIAEHDALS
jgi:hypothetical protein